MSRLCASLLLALVALAPARATEPSLDSVTVEARVEAGEPISVSMSYFLRPAGASSVSFTSIRFGDSYAANVRAFLGAREVSYLADGSSDSRTDGSVELPAGVAESDRFQLRLIYEVLPETELVAARSTIVLPLLVAEWPPAVTLSETFHASVHLPPGVVAFAAFPTEFTRIESVDRTSSDAYRFVLPVVPALIRLRAGTGEPSLLTVERGIDVAAVGLLLGLAIFGWRRMRESLT